jgi:hypothetical protein
MSLAQLLRRPESVTLVPINMLAAFMILGVKQRSVPVGTRARDPRFEVDRGDTQT